MANGSNIYQGPITPTGEAFVLPQNQAAGIFAAGLQDAVERQRALEAARLKRNQALADDNASILKNVKIGDHWGARSAELQDEYNKLNEYALKAARGGVNLNTDREFLEQRNQLLLKAQATKDLQKIYENTYREVGKNPDAFENGIEVLDSINKASLDDFRAGKFLPESLKRIYSLSDAIKESGGKTSYIKANDGVTDTTKVNRSGNVGQAIASITTPQAQYLIEKSGGDTGKYIAGFPTKMPDGRTYYNTNGDAFEDTVIQALATDAELPQFLQQKGYDVSSIDALRNSAFEFAKKQNQAAGKYVKDYADALENKATTDTTRVFTAEANRRANEAAARSAIRFSERGKKQEDVIYRKQFVDDMWNGVAGSGEKLKSIVGAKNGYKDNLGISVKDDKITFIIPEKTTTTKDAFGLETVKTTPGRNVTIDRSKPEEKSKLNQLVNELTGENISESKFQTGNSSGKIKTPSEQSAEKSKPVAKTINRSELAAKAASSGYGISEYEKLLKERGVIIK